MKNAVARGIGAVRNAVASKIGSCKKRSCEGNCYRKNAVARKIGAAKYAVAKRIGAVKTQLRGELAQ